MEISRRKIILYIDTPTCIMKFPSSVKGWFDIDILKEPLNIIVKNLKFKINDINFRILKISDISGRPISKHDYLIFEIFAIVGMSKKQFKRIAMTDDELEKILEFGVFLSMKYILYHYFQIKLMLENKTNIEHHAKLVIDSELEISLDSHGGSNNSSEIDHESENENESNSNKNSIDNPIGNKSDEDKFMESINAKNNFMKLFEYRYDLNLKHKSLKKSHSGISRGSYKISLNIEKMKLDKYSKDLVRILSKFAKRSNLQSENLDKSPLWNYNSVARRILQYQVPHEILDRHDISKSDYNGVWIYLDNSGSMSGFINEVEKIGSIITNVLNNVIVFIGPNGYIEDIHYSCQKVKSDMMKINASNKSDNNFYSYINISKYLKLKPELFLLISDFDTDLLVESLFDVGFTKRIIHTDNYCCNYGKPILKIKKSNSKSMLIKYNRVGSVGDIVHVLKKEKI